MYKITIENLEEGKVITINTDGNYLVLADRLDDDDKREVYYKNGRRTGVVSAFLVDEEFITVAETIVKDVANTILNKII